MFVACPFESVKSTSMGMVVSPGRLKPEGSAPEIVVNFPSGSPLGVVLAIFEPTIPVKATPFIVIVTGFVESNRVAVPS